MWYLLPFLILAQNDPKCGTINNKGSVYKVSDGVYDDRCFSLIEPSTTSENKLPILFWFHGAGGNAGHCGGNRGRDSGTSSMYDLAQKFGYVLVCGEALQVDHRGQWDIPEIINKTNDYCANDASTDMVYIQNVLKKLSENPKYDLSRIFTSGCSMGSAFSQFTAPCLKSKGFTISAFATHSTGLKVKGDGLKFPGSWHDHSRWGECDGCMYFPQRPQSWKKDIQGLGLKACIFDNTGDGDFYTSSQNLADTWTQLGNKAETHFLDGGHCQIHSFDDIIDCLDDGTGRLKNMNTNWEPEEQSGGRNSGKGKGRMPQKGKGMNPQNQWRPQRGHFRPQRDWGRKPPSKRVVV